MKVKDYTVFGGKHYESAAIRNTMAHAGVVAPHTGKPFTEALCFGIAGGIGIGYSYCPSVPGYGLGSGISIVGRHKMYSTDGAFYRVFFERIGARVDMRETGGAKAAHKNLCDGLAAGKPVIVWTEPLRVVPNHWAGSCGMYSTVVIGIDEEKNEAWIGDRASTALAIPLDELNKARGGVCSHKNRSLTFDPPKALTKKSLADAVLSGIEACVGEFLNPKIKTFSLPGLQEWSKLITNAKNKKGWLRAFPEGQIYLALRDVYDSIETAATGGSLFRSMYADFLEEAAAIAGKVALKDCAAEYRKLGDRWSELAEATLSSNVGPFKKTKDLLQESDRVFTRDGQKGLGKVAEIGQELRELEKNTVEKFPLGEKETTDLLEGLRERIVELYRSESEAIEKLQAAMD